MKRLFTIFFAAMLLATFATDAGAMSGKQRCRKDCAQKYQRCKDRHNESRGGRKKNRSSKECDALYEQCAKRCK